MPASAIVGVGAAAASPPAQLPPLPRAEKDPRHAHRDCTGVKNAGAVAAVCSGRTRDPRRRGIASVFHAKATTATIRGQLTAVPGRLARSAKRPVIHRPKDGPPQDS